MYLNLADAKDFLGDQLEAAYTGDDGITVDDAKLQSDLDYCNAFVLGYVRKFYANEVTGVESLKLLKGYTEIVLSYKSYQRFSRSTIAEGVQSAYEDVIWKLQAIGTGKQLLPDEDQSIPTSEVRASRFIIQKPLLTRSNLRDF